MSQNKKAADVEKDRARQASLKNWGDPPDHEKAQSLKRDVTVDCGWGRLIFGQTFREPESLAAVLGEEARNQRDVAIYVREPHVVLACAPQSLFLDPSHTFRLDLEHNDGARNPNSDIVIRPAAAGDERQINRLYLAWSMVPVSESFLSGTNKPAAVRVLVAEGAGHPNEIIGVVMGVDHHMAIADPDNGSSLWALAVDPQAQRPGIGEALISALADDFRSAGRAFMDLSVMHDNAEAIDLYSKLGFERIPVYAIKRKNPINEKLFIGPADEPAPNIYAQIIIDEAKRRGILVEIEDAERAFFRLNHGGRSIACRESLSDLTSAVALSRCDDKALTHRLLKRAGLRVPDQMTVVCDEDAEAFLAKYRRVVVKPAHGEQGRGVAVDLASPEDVSAALERARNFSDTVIMEAFVPGLDLRVIVIDEDVVAAAVRRPPQIRGDGRHATEELIEKLSRRREAATNGESSIPLDDETMRCVQAAGYKMSDVLPEGETVSVRKTANLHTGGTIHDVTDKLHETLRLAAVDAARTLEIPVVGLDFIVQDPAQPDFVIIEANERPGLANHEPQPTAERFIDLLFPQTIIGHRAEQKNG